MKCIDVYTLEKLGGSASAAEEHPDGAVFGVAAFVGVVPGQDDVVEAVAVGVADDAGVGADVVGGAFAGPVSVCRG